MLWVQYSINIPVHTLHSVTSYTGKGHSLHHTKTLLFSVILQEAGIEPATSAV